MNSEDRHALRLAISGASAAVSMHPQTLRKYERAGLLRPQRRQGGSRHYTEQDLARLELIKHMAEVRRINVAGMGLALAIWDDLHELLRELEEIEQQAARDFARERLRQIVSQFRAGAEA